MNLRALFHVACALILTFSIGRAVLLPPQSGPPRDPLAELGDVLGRAGFRLEAKKALVAPEAELTYVREDCSITVVFLPTIHRISLPAQSAIASMPSPPRLVHAGKEIASLSGATVIPRWLMQRLSVNFQVAEDSPWTSIALAIHEPPTCGPPVVKWNLLR